MANLTKKKRSSRSNALKRLKNNLQDIVDRCDLSINDIVGSNLVVTNETIPLKLDHLTNVSNVKTAQTQTTDPYFVYKSTVEDFSYEKISDLCSLFIDSISSWNAINFRFENYVKLSFKILKLLKFILKRIFSVIIYLILSKCNVKYVEKREILQVLNLLTIQRCEIWIKTLREEEDLTCITRDLRGNYKRNLFYELYPDLEQEAKAFAIEKLSQKKCSFKIIDLANFVNDRFKELYGSGLADEDSDDKNKLIRSVESIRCDLIRWGAVYDANKKRPYFEGHERDDVVKSRKEFCKYFIENKNLYYNSLRDKTIYTWV